MKNPKRIITSHLSFNLISYKTIHIHYFPMRYEFSEVVRCNQAFCLRRLNYLCTVSVILSFSCLLQHKTLINSINYWWAVSWLHPLHAPWLSLLAQSTVLHSWIINISSGNLVFCSYMLETGHTPFHYTTAAESLCSWWIINTQCKSHCRWQLCIVLNTAACFQRCCNPHTTGSIKTSWVKLHTQGIYALEDCFWVISAFDF